MIINLMACNRTTLQAIYHIGRTLIILNIPYRDALGQAFRITLPRSPILRVNAEAGPVSSVVGTHGISAGAGTKPLRLTHLASDEYSRHSSG